jgi:hypothetical protein
MSAHLTTLDHGAGRGRDPEGITIELGQLPRGEMRL